MSESIPVDRSQWPSRRMAFFAIEEHVFAEAIGKFSKSEHKYDALAGLRTKNLNQKWMLDSSDHIQFLGETFCAVGLASKSDRSLKLVWRMDENHVLEALGIPVDCEIVLLEFERITRTVNIIVSGTGITVPDSASPPMFLVTGESPNTVAELLKEMELSEEMHKVQGT